MEFQLWSHQLAAEEEITDYIITGTRSWQPLGGLALSGNDFGLAISPFALSNIPDMFSNFEGGIIDGRRFSRFFTSRQERKCKSIDFAQDEF